MSQAPTPKDSAPSDGPRRSSDHARQPSDQAKQPSVASRRAALTDNLSEPRQVTDVGELRALAHPLRLRLMEELVINDPATDTATATELAERLGESPANCSWHLRQLAKYGYIEEAPGGVGRERRWRAVLAVRNWENPTGDPEYTAASDAASDILYDHEYQAYRAQRAWRASEPADWRSSAFSLQSLGWLTADELRKLSEDFFELLQPGLQRLADPASRPPGARLIRFVSWGIPARPYVQDKTATQPDPEENQDA